MSDDEKEFYKGLLTEEKKNLIEELIEENESAESLLRDDLNDTVDYANANSTQKILAVLNENTKKRLTSIDAALRRVNGDGAFGECNKCGKIIQERRLKTVPWATKCISCKKIEESKLKVH